MISGFPTCSRAQWTRRQIARGGSLQRRTRRIERSYVIEAIQACGIGEEKRPLIIRRQLRGDSLEGVVRLIERCVEPGDRKITGEHCSPSAETFEAVEDHFRETFERPMMVIGDKVGNFDRHVGRAGQNSQALSPTLHPFRIAIDRAATMVENEKLVWKVSHQSFSLPKLAGKNHQIEDKSERLQPCEAGAPSGIVHEVAARCEPARRVFAPTQDIANADNARKARLRLDQCGGLSAGKWNMGDIPRRDAIGFIERFKPSRFANAIVAHPPGFDMNAGNDILPNRVATIILGQVVAFERREIPETAECACADREPRMTVEAQIPQVVMGVDDRAVIYRGHAVLHFRRVDDLF